MENIRKDVEREASQLGNAAADNVRDLGDKARNASRSVGDKIENATDQADEGSLEKTFSQVKDVICEGTTKVTEVAETLYDDVMAAVKKYPGQALVAGLALGLGLRALISRNKDA